MDTSHLTEYLGHVYALESELYGIGQAINVLEWKRNQAQNIREKPLQEKPVHNFEAGVCLFCSIIITVVLIVIYVAILALAGAHDDPLRIFTDDWSLTMVKLVGIMAVIFLVLLCLNIKSDNDDDAKIDKYNEQLQEQNMQIQEYRSWQISLCDKMVSDVKKTYNEVKNTLNEYYSANVIFPKYRGLIQVASFYEYLTSGRCEDLTGVHGAYNKYEEECRQNLIIEKLDTIIQQLESIKNNQFMLYQAINNQTQAVNSLNGNVQNALDRMDSIQAIQYVQAYNQEILARNSQELVSYKRWSETR